MTLKFLACSITDREDKKMTLPKIVKRKLIKKEEFKKIARKVRQSLRDEAKYLNKRKVCVQNDSNSTDFLNFC